MRKPVSLLALSITLGLGSAYADTNSTDLVKQGEYVSRLGDCVACHTAPGGQPYAGGLPFQTPMGTLYATNITPDPETGIGGYSFEEFSKAVRQGVAKDGRHLYPAMPYTSFVLTSDEDMRALYAYFLQGGVKAVKQPNKQADIPWPLNMRWPLAVWNGLFLQSGPYKSDASKSAEWNRGAYLVEGLAHCGTCHTPRGIMMQEKGLRAGESNYLAGSDLKEWYAFNITSDPNSGIGQWSVEEISQYLKTGNVPDKAQAAGMMGEAVEHSFSHMQDADIKAIAVYLKTIPAVSQGETKSRSAWGTPAQDVYSLRGVSYDAQNMDAARMYLGNCASCHSWSGTGDKDGYYPSLVHNSAVGVTGPQTKNLIQTILTGINRNDVFMPAFGKTLNDDQVAALTNYVLEHFGNPQAKVTAKDVKDLRAH